MCAKFLYESEEHAEKSIFKLSLGGFIRKEM